MMREHDRVVLSSDLSEEGLQAGDVGTIVHIYPHGEAFEVEFVALNGETVAVVTIKSGQIRAVREGEITHARALAPA